VIVTSLDSSMEPTAMSRNVGSLMATDSTLSTKHRPRARNMPASVAMNGWTPK
jgi:hypothetical protein